MTRERSEAEAVLHSLLRSVQGLQAILLSTADGATLLRATSEEFAEASNPDFETNVAANFGDAEGQLAKLGDVSSLTVMQSTSMFLFTQVAPLVIVLIAGPDANTGMLKECTAAISELPAVAALRQAAGSIELRASQM